MAKAIGIRADRSRYYAWIIQFYTEIRLLNSPRLLFPSIMQRRMARDRLEHSTEVRHASEPHLSRDQVDLFGRTLKQLYGFFDPYAVHILYEREARRFFEGSAQIIRADIKSIR